jgi:isopentenyl-diphosphate delta-isomerase
VVQPEGDKDFRGGIETFERLVESLDRPVIAKETGCGISYTTASRLYDAGVRHVDVSGAGGTSWVAVEMLRARGGQRSLGELLREWGIPTAASVAMSSMANMKTILATGGVSTGLDAARALALGADAAGLARPVLQALGRGGTEGARAMMARLEQELRAVMLLVGSRNLAHLRNVPRILSPSLQAWVAMAERQSLQPRQATHQTR